MAYHLAQEARAGVSEFRIPRDFGDKLFAFQVKAVQIAAHHLNKRGGVLIGDVVGLGKTLLATALARIFEDEQGLETLILCPRNLVRMWEDYRDQYRLRGRVLAVSMARKMLPELTRFRLVLIDESHNLRNPEGKTYRAIRDYIEKMESKCILLSATPYNKTYQDLTSQLRLFIPDDQDLGVRPEKLLRELTETEFIRRYQCGVRTLTAFSKSPYADDWRELMRLFLVRRTRSFIKQHYAQSDPQTGRKFLTTSDGARLPFPDRVPRTIKVKIDRKDGGDQYARLYDPEVVDAINRLYLPRYGLANYIPSTFDVEPTAAEAEQFKNLSKAGRRLMGFCRTNLFKRLESSGQSFLLSIERHILRNCVFLHALQNDLPLPLGTQGAELLDSRFTDADEPLFAADPDEEGDAADEEPGPIALQTEPDFARRAEDVYKHYAGPLRQRFNWMRAPLFVPALAQHLGEDVKALLSILAKNGCWNADADAKLQALLKLVNRTHPDEKVLVFTQFADTVHYVADQLQRRGVARAAGVTGRSDNPTALAWRFSPISNDKRRHVAADQELRVLIATDVLSEGQNLQDAAIVVNYDLPWAIIRLIQRAGRVDRIGQTAEQILCYSFLPADGVNRIIRLRERVTQRLQENAEVVGSDEAFFEGPASAAALDHLYNEKAGLLDGEADNEIDLSSYAYQIWNDAIAADPILAEKIHQLPNVVYSTKAHTPSPTTPEGVLVYLRSAQGNDAIAWLDRKGNSITESQFAILDAAACTPETPAVPRHPSHHQLVRCAVERAAQEEKQVGGQLGRPSGARFRTYERLRHYADAVKGTLFDTRELLRAVEEIYRFPLCQTARDTLNRQLKAGIDGHALAELVLALRGEGRLCQVSDEIIRQEPQIICSLGLRAEP
jgi:superfamily II DNA or RNA helicase